MYLDQNRGSEPVSVPAKTIARSLVEDYIISQPAQDQEAGPGLFWVPDALTMEQVKAKHPQKLADAETIQKEWWIRLVRLADDIWQQNHKHSQLGDLDRTACRQLALKRDWLDDTPNSMIQCPVCTTVVSAVAIVCFACKVILRPEEYGKFQFAGVPQPGIGLPVQTLNTK